MGIIKTTASPATMGTIQTREEKLMAYTIKKVATNGMPETGEILFTKKELLSAGLNDHNIANLLKAKSLTRVQRGVYRMSIGFKTKEHIMNELYPEITKRISTAINNGDYLEVNRLRKLLPSNDSNYFLYLLSKIVELQKEDISEVIGIGKNNIKPTTNESRTNTRLDGSRKKAFNGDFAGAIKDLKTIEYSQDLFWAITAEKELLEKANEAVQEEITAKQDSASILAELLSDKIPESANKGHVILIEDLNEYEGEAILAYSRESDTIQAEPVYVEGQPCIAARIVEKYPTMKIGPNSKVAYEKYRGGDLDGAIEDYVALLKNMKNKDSYVGEVYKMLGLSYYEKFKKGDYSLDDINNGLTYLSLAISRGVRSNSNLEVLASNLSTEKTMINRRNRKQKQIGVKND